MGARIAAAIDALFATLRTAATILVAAVLSFAPFAANAADPLNEPVDKSVKQVDWSKVPALEKKVLAPLEKDWAQLAGSQQRRLIGAAREFPKLTPQEQERFQSRLRNWVALTPEQRAQAREKHRTLTALPPEKQTELRQRWEQTRSERPSGDSQSPSPPPATKQ